MIRTATLASYQERMARALTHIQNHLDEPLPLESLAGVACFSPFHFHRIFRGMVGESVKEHVRRLRLERAAQRLKLSPLAVTQIALDAGYETHESFTRAFRAMFGVPPSEYRESGSRFATPPGGGPPLDVRIEHLDALRVAYVRHVGPFEGVGVAWGKLMCWAGPAGAFGPHTRMLGICPDDPAITAPAHLRYDAALTVPAHILAQGEIAIQETVPGDYAAVTHRGPYEQLGDTYARLCGEWLPASGCEARGAASIEFYLNSPQDTAPPDLLTRILLPLV